MIFFSVFLYAIYSDEIILNVLFCSTLFFSIIVLTYGFSSVFSYLLLHNKLLQSLVALHNNFFNQNLWGSGILSIAGWFWFGVSLEAAIKMSFDNFTEATGSASKMAFRQSCWQEVSVPHWPLAGGRGSSLWGSSCRTTQVSSLHVSWLSPE